MDPPDAWVGGDPPIRVWGQGAAGKELCASPVRVQRDGASHLPWTAQAWGLGSAACWPLACRQVAGLVPWVCSRPALRGVLEAPWLLVQRPWVPVLRVQGGPEQAAVWRQLVCWELLEPAWALVLQEQRPWVPAPRVQDGREQAAVWRRPVCWELPEPVWLLVLQEPLPFSQTELPYRLAVWRLLRERRFA